jgi:apolipoprotein D and lipocalin family protein
MRSDYKNSYLMSKALIAFGVAITALLIVLGTNVSENSLRSNLGEPKTVPYVDIDKYAGAWYEQSVIPFFFERGCSKTIATYSKNSDGTLKVDNSCVRNGKKV